MPAKPCRELSKVLGWRTFLTQCLQLAMRGITSKESIPSQSPAQPCKKHVKIRRKQPDSCHKTSPIRRRVRLNNNLGVIISNGWQVWNPALKKQPVSPQRKVEPDHKTVVNMDRRFVRSLGRLLQTCWIHKGRTAEHAIRRANRPKYERYSNCPRALLKLGYLHGLWMLVSREGTRILVRYHSWFQPDSCIEGHMEVVGAGY